MMRRLKDDHDCGRQNPMAIRILKVNFKMCISSPSISFEFSLFKDGGIDYEK